MASVTRMTKLADNALHLVSWLSNPPTATYHLRNSAAYWSDIFMKPKVYFFFFFCYSNFKNNSYNLDLIVTPIFSGRRRKRNCGGNFCPSLGKRILETHGVPMNNIIGFDSDGCNAMIKERNTVMSWFKKACPGIFISKCICYSLHLCTSEEANELYRVWDHPRGFLFVFALKVNFKKFEEFEPDKLLEMNYHDML